MIFEQIQLLSCIIGLVCVLQHSKRYKRLLSGKVRFGNIVNLDGKRLFCDVGYGGPIPHGSIEEEDMPLLQAARLNCL